MASTENTAVAPVAKHKSLLKSMFAMDHERMQQLLPALERNGCAPQQFTRAIRTTSATRSTA